MHIVVFAVLIPLKLWLLFWLMTQEWFWMLLLWLAGIGLVITAVVLLGQALSRIAQ